MSEKQQHTAAHLQVQMEHRYGDGLHHKHNKNHMTYRQHFKSHPVPPKIAPDLLHTSEEELQKKAPTGLLRYMKLRKLRKRLDKGRIH